MKLLWRLGKEAGKYRGPYIVVIATSLLLTLVNLAAPRVLTSMTSYMETGFGTDAGAVILRLALMLTGLYVLRVVFRFASNYVAHRLAWHLVRDLRVRVYSKMQGLSMSYFHDKQTGDLMSRVMNDTVNFELLYAHIIPEMVINVVTVVGVVSILFTINPQLALLTCIPVPFIILGGFIFAKKIRPMFRVAQKAVADINAKIQDNLSGIHEIQAFGRLEDEERKVSERVTHHVSILLRSLKLSGLFHPIVEFFSAAGTVIVVGAGGYLAWRGADLSVSDILGFLLYLSLFYAPITGLARLIEDMQSAFAGAERVVAVLDHPQEIEDSQDAEDLPSVRGEITFDRVSFAYQNEVPVLKNISFTVKPGQMVALVGPTGVGKTTATQLISRFYDPTEGRILIDGRDIRHCTLESLRKNIAPVLQDTYLFNGTIAENIAYSHPGASRDDLVAAAKAARIHESILEMPDGYETQVGERGLRLSGGQKQRVAIARAILRAAPIIVLDEATASVDTATEREIQSAIDHLMKRRTIIAIAHRLSTIQNADVILVLSEGEVVQQGNHEELIAQPGLYRDLAMAAASDHRDQL